MRGKLFKFIARSFLLLAAIFLLAAPSWVSSGPDVSVHNSFTWATDLEWSSWSLNNIETNGSNSGIRLSDIDGGGYQTWGEATYKFSPGGKNKWIKATLDADNATQLASKYIWASIYNKNSVSQIDTDDGSIVKEWDVGINPSRTAVGCNNDAWILNRGHGTTSQPSSLSHIIPADNKVITHNFPLIYRYARAISIACSAGPDYLWIGANGYVIKLNAEVFDNLPDGALATEAQVGSTVSILPGDVYATYGSVFGLNSDYLYVAKQLDERLVYKIRTSDHTLMGGNFPVVGGRYIITNDWLGNIWRDGRCVRIQPDGAKKELCSGGGIGLTVLPAIPDQGAKVAYSKRVEDKLELCVADLIGNDTTDPILANTSCTSGDSLGGIDLSDDRIMGGGMAYDSDYDIWYLPRKGNFISEFKRSENYLIGHRYRPTNKEGGAIYSYSDFLGNALDNSTGASVKLECSTDGVTFFSLNPDGTFPEQVESSTDLYFRIQMTGSGTNSPLLKSLKIEYDPEGFSNLRILRTTHRSSLSRDSGEEESTFERGETVYVRIKLFEPERARNDITLTDRFSNVSNPRNFRFKSGCSGRGKSITTQNVGTNQVSLVFNLPLGLSCIDYEYTAN